MDLESISIKDIGILMGISLGITATLAVVYNVWYKIDDIKNYVSRKELNKGNSSGYSE